MKIFTYSKLFAACVLLTVMGYTLGIKSTLAGAKPVIDIGTALGQKVPELEGKTLDGKLVRLSDYQGKYVVLVFWASWCPACREEMPNIVRLHRMGKELNLEVISVALDRKDGEDHLRKEVAKHFIKFPVIWEASEGRSELAKAWGVTGTPTSFLIDPQGIILAKGFQGKEGIEAVTNIIKMGKGYFPPPYKMKPSVDLTNNAIRINLHLGKIDEGQSKFKLYLESHGRADTKIMEELEFVLERRILDVKSKEMLAVKPVRTAKDSKDKFQFSVSKDTDGYNLEITYRVGSAVPTTFVEVKYFDKTLERYMVVDSGFVKA